MIEPLTLYRGKPAAVRLLCAFFIALTSNLFALTPPPGTPITNTAVVKYSNINNNILLYKQATVQTIISAAPVLRITKIANTNPVSMGSIITYTIDLTNIGNSPATDIMLSDFLSKHIIFQSSSGGVYTQNADGGTLVWNIPILLPGQTLSFTITARVKTPDDYQYGDPDTIRNGTIITNVANVISPLASASTTLQTIVGENPRLEISQIVSSTISSPGETLTYSINYRNTGNASASGVFITSSIPNLTAVLPDTISNSGTIRDNSVLWYIGNIEPGQQGFVSFNVKISEIAELGNIIVNNVSINSNEIGSIAANTVYTLVSQSSASLSITKKAKTSTAFAGSEISYTIEIVNNGSQLLTGVMVKDNLPQGTVFLSADNGGIFTGNQVIWNIGTFGVGETKKLTLTVRGPLTESGSSIVNTAIAECNQLAPVSDSATIVLNARTAGVIEFLDENWNPKYSYKTGDTVYLQVSDLDRNTDPFVVESIEVILTSETGDSEILFLIETGPDTGVFRGFISTIVGQPVNNNGTLSVIPDVQICATYYDPLDVVSIITKAAFIDPYGIVFNSVTGQPLQGVIVTLIDATTNQPAILPFDPNPSVPTATDGKYVFMLVPPGSYYIQLSNLPDGYTYPSVLPDDQLPPGFTIGQGSKGEIFELVSGMEPVNLDIPVDPVPNKIVVSKSTNKNSATIGDVVRYTITINNDGESPITDVKIYDTMPHGINYIKNSSTLDGIKITDPKNDSDRTIIWQISEIAAGATVELVYRALIGPDSHKSDGKNYVVVSGFSAGKQIFSNRSFAKVNITEGVFTSKGTIIGKVFLDKNKNKLQDAGEEGISNVAIYMEDGTRVVTDKDGKYSIPLVEPGIHVLRVDETTLPTGFVLIPISQRFSQSESSQFVDVPRYGISKVNFAVVEKRDNGIFTIQIESGKDIKKLEKTMGNLRDISDIRIEKINGIYTVRAGIYETEQEAKKALEKIIKEFPGSIVRKAYFFEDRVVSKYESYFPETQQKNEVSIDWEQKIKEMKNDLAFLSLEDRMILMSNQPKILLKAPLNADIKLFVNNCEISEKQIGKKIKYEIGNIAIYEFVGISLIRGENNILTAQTVDSFGNIRDIQSISVYIPGKVEKVLVIPEKDSVYADGRSSVLIEINVFDRNKSIVPYTGLATVEVSCGEIKEPDIDKYTSGYQIPLSQGKGKFTVISPYQVSIAEIKVHVEDVCGSAKISFTPYLRDIMLVGVGELKIGYGNKKGINYFDERNFDDGLYNSGKASLFIKRKIFEKMLLTASYDSSKKKNSDFFRENQRNIESEQKYPVYGDESKIGYEAMSTDKLYVKIEKGMSYVMYGDFRTNLDDTRLSAYHRTFTGFSSKMQFENLNSKLFATHSSRSRFIDIIRGKGISGYYYCSRTPVIEGSERVVIETRDRFRPDRVLKREILVYGYDYWIDYDSGSILFKSPVPSMDINLNPVYIVVSYENETSGEKYYIYGGRVSFKSGERFELGLTSITEEKEMKDYHLTGIDAKIKMPLNTTINIEWAQTDSIFDISGLQTSKTAHAYLLKVEGKPLENITINAYYTKADNYFDNPSATDIMRGTEKYGLEFGYTAGKRRWAVFGKYFNEKDTLNKGTYEHISTGIARKFEKTEIKLETYYENSNNNYIPPTQKNSRYPFDISQDLPEHAAGLKMSFERKIGQNIFFTGEYKSNLIATAGNMGHIGLEYQIDKTRKMYMRQQFAHLEKRFESFTVAGVEKQIGKNTVAFNEYSLNGGMEGDSVQHSIGIRNSFMLGKDVTGNISVENLHTISGRQRQDNPDAFAIGLGLEYLPAENMKVTSRIEHRTADDAISNLIEFGIAYKLNPACTMLLRERFFHNDLDRGVNMTHRTTIGFAYRPVSNDRLNLLARLEIKNDRDTNNNRYDESSYIASLEGVYQVNSTTQITAKYAGKFAEESSTSVYTDLISVRLIKDIGRRLDIGAEYRILNNHSTGSFLQGGSIELGYNLLKNIWLSLGYSFDKFDTDLVGDNYNGTGPFLRLRIKFDESIFKQMAK